METIKLKSKDGKIFTANRSILTRSAVLQRKLEELTAADANGDTLDVPEADGDCLRKLIQWMQRPDGMIERIDKDSVEMMIPNNQEQRLLPSAGVFETEMFSGFPQMCVLMAAANRLRVQDFIQAAVHFILSWRQGKNLEDIREMMEYGANHVRGSHQAGDGSGMQH